jgi:hypothetical protein
LCRRAASYWFADGVPEIISGAALAMLAVTGLWFSQRTSGRVWLLVLMALLLAILFGLDRRIARYIKARMTWPRTGYVRPPLPIEQERPEVLVSLGIAEQPPRDENVTGYVSHTVVVLMLSRMAFGLLNAPWGLPLVLAAAAITICALNRRGERPYRWWSVASMPAAGLVLMPIELVRVAAGQWLPVLVGGVWLLAQGMATLFCYLRRNPRPAATMPGLAA